MLLLSVSLAQFFCQAGLCQFPVTFCSRSKTQHCHLATALQAQPCHLTAAACCCASGGSRHDLHGTNVSDPLWHAMQTPVTPVRGLQRYSCLLSWCHLQIVKGPVTRYLPADAIRIGFSHKAAEVKDIFKFVREDCQDDRPIVFVVGAFAHGKVDASYVDHEISISSYPLSAAQALTRITNACEQRLGIV